MLDVSKKAEMLLAYIETAERVSDRRAQMNTWMLSINTFLASFYGYLKAGELSVRNEADKGLWLLAIPFAGGAVCVAWRLLLTSYRKLNAAKFAVIQEAEKDIGLSFFTEERKKYKISSRSSFSVGEGIVPVIFGTIYFFLAIVSIF